MRSLVIRRRGLFWLFNFNSELGRPQPPLTHPFLPSSPSRNLRCIFSSITALGSNINSNSISKSAQQNGKMVKGQEEKQLGANCSSISNSNSNSKSNPNPKVNIIQQLTPSDSSGGWETCWEQGVTPWDLGQPTPVLVHLHQTNALPKGRTLVPGCGSGHDVVAIACRERYVVGLDISEKATKKAIELSSLSPNAEYCTFLTADFFTWRPTELFDLIFDYTFFCAIEPDMRSAWGSQMRDLLKPDGELITLIFPIDDHVGGPPYKVSVSDYEEVLHPLGFEAISVVENELAVGPRKGREKLGRWKKSISKSML